MSEHVNIVSVALPESATEQETENAAWNMFATAHPHEAFAKWPERFWQFFHKQHPRVDRETMEAMLKETE